jgi:hypothetical protein
LHVCDRNTILCVSHVVHGNSVGIVGTWPAAAVAAPNDNPSQISRRWIARVTIHGGKCRDIGGIGSPDDMPKVTVGQAREKAMETRKLARVAVDPEQHRDAKLKACAALDGASLQLSRRFGYRRLLIFLRREGFVVNHKRLFRMCREERLMVRKRASRKRGFGLAHDDAWRRTSERPLVSRFRLRSVRQRTSLPYSRQPPLA